MPHPLWATCSNVWLLWKKCFCTASCNFPSGHFCLLPLVLPLCHSPTADSQPASWPPGPSDPFPQSHCLARQCQHLLVCGGVPSRVSESACVLELHEAPVSLFSQPFQVSVDSSSALQLISCCPWFLLSMKLLKVHCVLMFGSLAKTLYNIGPSISPWEMPVVTSCQDGLDNTDKDNSLSLMVQPVLYPTDSSITQLAYKIAVGICVEYLAEFQINNIHGSLLGYWNSYLIRQSGWLGTICL